MQSSLGSGSDVSSPPSHNAIAGALLADALTLSTHYDYDAQNIQSRYRDELPADLEAAFLCRSRWHPTKGPGDQTDYGDALLRTVNLLQVNPSSGLSELDFEACAADWHSWAATYEGYRSSAMRQVVAERDLGTPWEECASAAADLVALPRVLPLLALRHADEQQLVDAALAMTV